MLTGKKILLGVTGSIAAYKAVFLLRLLQKEGAEVRVIMTPSATDFVAPLTFSTLSNHKVYLHFTEGQQWENHVDAALWADMLLIAPATAHTLAGMAAGLCDSFLLATYLSSKSAVYVAPAMDLDMYKHPQTRNNISHLQKQGVKVIPSAFGELASGLTGEGRMEEPEKIILFLKQDLEEQMPLRGKKALVTAGPTYEALDPVRFIGNHSSGKMGFALASVIAAAGAEVTLISGPVSLETPKNVNRINITSADEMFKQCMAFSKEADIIIMSAAVADYSAASKSEMKRKKGPGAPVIELHPSKDILHSLGTQKRENQVLVGFALEDTDELENARKKLTDKNLDFIVLNSMRDEGAGFGTDTNKITIIDKDEKITRYGLKSKKDVAKDIVKKIIEDYIN